MTDEKKRPRDSFMEDPPYGDIDLPPLEDDAVEETNPATLADYLDDFEEEWTDPEPNISADSVEEVADELLDSSEGSWLDEGGPERELEEIDLGTDHEEVWSENTEQESTALEDDWFAEETESSVLEDGGIEGPVDDADIVIDRSGWEELDGWEESIDEPIEVVMERLGISLAQIQSEFELFDSPIEMDALTETQFLGPRDGRTFAISVHGDIQIAVGAGLFMRGADDMLHQMAFDSDIQGTSVCSHGNLTFIGTSNMGALLMTGSEARLTPVNGWNALGVGDEPDCAVSIPFYIAGHSLENDEYRLVGCTMGGQLFASLDLGLTWHGPLTNERCMTLAIIEETGELLVLVESSKGAKLLKSKDLKDWEEIGIPKALQDLANREDTTMAADSKTIVVGVNDPNVPLFCSLDGGKSWRASNTIKGASAVALEPEDPGCIVTATYHPGQDLGLVKISRDGGGNWKSLLVTGRQGTGDPLGLTEEGSRNGMVRQIAIKTGTRLEIFVVANEGVHRLLLSTRDASH